MAEGGTSPPLPNDLNKQLSAFKYSWPFPEKRSLFYEIKSRLTIAGVYLTAKLIFTCKYLGFQQVYSIYLIVSGLNRMKVENRQTFIRAVEDRTRPLITVSNHRCNVDDPLIWSKPLCCRSYSFD